MENIELTKEAKQQILKIPEEHERQHNKQCKAAHEHNVDDLVVIQKTQIGTS